MAAPQLNAKIEEHALLVNRAMESYLPRERGKFATSMREYLERGNRRVRPSMAVYEPIRHVVAAGGKRIRPTLCLLACEAAGGTVEQALPTAVGIEFLHTFTLVHDDIMDRALTRRGKPTVGALWGDDVAITVGDGLFALAFKAFAANADVPGVPAERVTRVVARASETSLLLAQGQTLDLLFARRDDVAPDEYLEMVRLKTGVLLEFAVEAGATLGGADESHVRAMSRFASPLGVAFQLRDDLIDLTGDASVTGKPVGNDIRTGKRTLMVAHAFANAKRAKRLAEILDAPVEETSDADVAEAVGILRDAGSIEYVAREAEKQLAAAKRGLADLPRTGGGASLESLAALADYILHREK
ncbi:MAG: polyprenyl synthetase family protein [Thermoplasmatota archaeon]